MELKEYRLWDDNNGKRLLLIAMILALLTHGVIVYYTLPRTYDAFVHMFFGDHYSRFWFEPWEYRWYTGFLTISYPPLIHQSLGFVSKVFPMKVAFCICAIGIFEILLLGIYRFTKIFFDRTTAGVAAILAVVLSSFVETLHVFGQLPTLTGLSFLLNALPFLYQYVTKRKTIYLVMTMAFISVVVCSHHVTAIFGMVFFIAPTIFMAITDSMPLEHRQKKLFPYLWEVVVAAWDRKKEIILIGGLTIVFAVTLIFPYWYWSKTDPITQVSIPHGSRNNFFEVTSSGLVFYVIPLILIFALLPAISYVITKKKRHIAWAVSFYLCLLLGSGGTTPLPELILGSNAFNILTLDRFGFWASIVAIPYMALFLNSFVGGQVKDFLVEKLGKSVQFALSGFTGFFYFLFLIFVFHLGTFRPLQPSQVELKPLLNFLNRDDHMRWRYLTLGFGDQMAWLSSNSLAASVDGNYHSARRLPEMTTRPVERLENAKFNGDEGMASLRDFLTDSEKYSLKYIFSNDRYYDPLLYYTGWNRTIRLENGIMVWEKGNISTIKPLVPKEILPFLKKTWGIIPFTTVVIAFLLTLLYMKKFKDRNYLNSEIEWNFVYPKGVIYASSLIPIVLFSGFILSRIYELLLVNEHATPTSCMENYYNHLDFQRFEDAHGFFEPTPDYTLDQYLLQKSVMDGGLQTSYAKLDSISVITKRETPDSAFMSVFTNWRTALGNLTKDEEFNLVKKNGNWYIIPPPFVPEIPEAQMRSYTYTLFKKQGKRVISAFPTVKDDRVKKPFAAFKQAHVVAHHDQLFLTGELLNADDIPINVALKATLRFHTDTAIHYYPTTAFHYNIAPKGRSYFQIDLDSLHILDSLALKSIELYASTDVSEKGYVHGGTPITSLQRKNDSTIMVSAEFYNELSSDINIPGLLLAEKDGEGRILQTQLYVNRHPVRSGMSRGFTAPIHTVAGKSWVIESVPLQVFVNGQPRTVSPLKPDPEADSNFGLRILPHCFISQEIFLQ